MALVGVVEPGTISNIFRTLSRAKGDALLLVEHEGVFAHVLFSQGDPTSAGFDGEDDADALPVIETWDAGFFSLIKRKAGSEETSGAQALLVNLDKQNSTQIEPWLEEGGYTTSLVAYPQQALQVISFIKPKAILLGCLKQAHGMTCEVFRARVRESSAAPPVVISVADPEDGCTAPHEFSQASPITRQRLEDLLWGRLSDLPEMGTETERPEAESYLEEQFSGRYRVTIGDAPTVDSDTGRHRIIDMSGPLVEPPPDPASLPKSLPTSPPTAPPTSPPAGTETTARPRTITQRVRPLGSGGTPAWLIVMAVALIGAAVVAALYIWRG
jgi:CheY-like chemotaxis protein